MKTIFFLLASLAAYSQTAGTPVTLVGSGAPSASCTTGNAYYFDTAASAGSNLYLCTGTNTWTQVTGGGGGATSLTQLTDLKVTRTSSTVITIASGRPGNNNYACPVLSAATATLSGTTGNSTAYIYTDNACNLIVGHAGASTVTCSGCTTATGVSSFLGKPIATATYSNNGGSPNWDVSGVTDYRQIFSGFNLSAGTGISLTTDATGNVTVTNTGTTSAVSIGWHSPWGMLAGNGGNDTSAFSANQTRWQAFNQLVSMTVTGVGIRSSTGINGAGKGIRFAIADSGGTILYKTAVNTTCASTADCRAAFSSPITLSGGLYYFGMTTDSTAFNMPQAGTGLLDGMPYCKVVDNATAPKLAGTGTAGSGSGGSVDFGASMGALTAYSCNGGSNTLVGNFIYAYFY